MTIAYLRLTYIEINFVEVPVGLEYNVHVIQACNL